MKVLSSPTFWACVYDKGDGPVATRNSDARAVSFSRVPTGKRGVLFLIWETARIRLARIFGHQCVKCNHWFGNILRSPSDLRKRQIRCQRFVFTWIQIDWVACWPTFSWKSLIVFGQSHNEQKVTGAQDR